LSLFGCLGKKSVSLSEFFRGAILGIPVDITIKIPSIEELQVSVIEYRYPSTYTPAFEIGNCVLNGNGAPFDAFIYLETANQKLLLALQMKISRFSSRTGPINNQLINEEYQKVNKIIDEKLHGTDFVFVMLCRRDGNFNRDLLPSKSAIVCNSNLNSFYGDAYFQRLKKQ
jgi:hypothetical protein